MQVSYNALDCKSTYIHTHNHFIHMHAHLCVCVCMKWCHRGAVAGCWGSGFIRPMLLFSSWCDLWLLLCYMALGLSECFTAHEDSWNKSKTHKRSWTLLSDADPEEKVSSQYLPLWIQSIEAVLCKCIVIDFKGVCVCVVAAGWKENIHHGFVCRLLWIMQGVCVERRCICLWSTSPAAGIGFCVFLH